MSELTEKILILRFSSFGDITQALSIPSALHSHFPNAQVHWATRSDFAPLIQGHPKVHKVWTLNRGAKLRELLSLSRELKAEGFTRVYDAHNSLRSRFISAYLRPRLLCRKPSYRIKRFLLFKLRINLFPQPFSGQRDLLEPLQAWGVPKEAPDTPQLFLAEESLNQARKSLESQNFLGAIALAPSAAHALKRWPIKHWIKLIELMPNQKFILLGGPEDKFIDEIASAAPDRCLNLSGKCDLLGSSSIIQNASLLIANDTGLLHVGEQIGKATIALMGPAPFGFPSRKSTKILEVDLKCRPCSKHGQGPCINPEYQKCMVDISPSQVAIEAHRILESL